MNKNCGIYKITSPTGRVYIGQSQDIDKRKKDYANNHSNLKGQTRIYNSLCKYGWENHQFDIIEYCSVDELNCSERFWQDEFDVLNGGLNCTLQECGGKRRIMSEETKRKIGKATKGVRVGEKNPMFGKVGARKGVTVSEETKKKMSDFAKERFKEEDGYWKGKTLSEDHVKKSVESKKAKYVKEDNPNYGKKRSDETKKRISDTRKEKGYSRGNHPLAKLVLDTQTGIFYDCLKDVSEAYEIKYTRLRYILDPKTKSENKTPFIYC